MGIGDCKVYNPECKVILPNLEKLAETGMVFTDAHAPAAVCAPTRYSILTGNYPWREEMRTELGYFICRLRFLKDKKH